MRDDEGMPQHEEQPACGRFDVHAIAQTFPAAADSMLLDVYLTREASASTRVFRVYQSTPPHYHRGSDEHLYVVSGRGTFWMEDPEHIEEFAPGHLLFFRRGIVHAMPTILEGPVVFLAIDTPPREPTDIIFVNPEDGSPEKFIQPLS
jgi:mannose-6-phosphate isomerase-like protein (cupin superfamily)